MPFEVFDYTKNDDGSGTLNLNVGDISFSNFEEFSKLNIKGSGQTFEIGMPELPTYSTFYQVYPAINYDINYTVNEITTIDDIRILPYVENENKRASRMPTKNLK